MDDYKYLVGDHELPRWLGYIIWIAVAIAGILTLAGALV